LRNRRSDNTNVGDAPIEHYSESESTEEENDEGE
ncbi:unnamed protein product, partial [Didymodactylos carnosus]